MVLGSFRGVSKGSLGRLKGIFRNVLNSGKGFQGLSGAFQRTPRAACGHFRGLQGRSGRFQGCIEEFQERLGLS